MAAAALALRWGLLGSQLTISTACASSLEAIGHAAGLIEQGDADVALAGGTAPLVSVVAWSLQRAGALATATEARLASRPFDRAHRIRTSSPEVRLPSDLAGRSSLFS